MNRLRHVCIDQSKEQVPQRSSLVPHPPGSQESSGRRARGCGREGGEVTYKLTLCTDGGMFVSTSLNSRFRSGLAWFPTHQS